MTDFLVVACLIGIAALTLVAGGVAVGALLWLVADWWRQR